MDFLRGADARYTMGVVQEGIGGGTLLVVLRISMHSHAVPCYIFKASPASPPKQLTAAYH